MHILLVDDVADTRFIFRTSFELVGHTMHLVSHGLEAIAAVQEQLFDAIIMDLAMPDMDGWQTTEAIRQLPHGAHVPVIIFTAHSQRNVSQKASQVGADYVLQKPMTPSDLRQRVEEIVNRRNSDTTRLSPVADA